MTDLAVVNVKVKAESSEVKRASDDLDQFGKSGQRASDDLYLLGKSGKRASDDLNAVAGSGKRASDEVRELALNTPKATSAFSLLRGVLAGLGLVKIATDAMATYRSFESMSASLKTMTGSASAATAAFAEIEKFAEETPYNLDKSVEGFIKLKALGLDPSMDSLRSYGNTSAAMGKDLMQMVEAVADASTGEFERLKEFGIKSKKEGENVSFTFQGVTTTIKGSSENIQQYLLDIGNTQFAGAMADQMDTVNGAVSNTQDKFSKFQRVFIVQSGAADAFKTSLMGISGVLDWLTVSMEDSADKSAQGLIKLKESGLEPSKASLISYGNTAAAMGKDLLQMIDAVADASAGEFKLLEEFGIKSKKEGENISFTFQGVTTTIEESSENIQKYLLDIGNTQFAGAMADQMDTVNDVFKVAYTAVAALSIILSRKLIISVTAYTAANVRAAASMIAVNAAAIRQAPALIGAAAAMNAGTIAARGLAGVMALVGGPIGLIALAAIAAYTYSDELIDLASGSDGARKAEEEHAKVLDKIRGLAYKAAGGSSELTRDLQKEGAAALKAAEANIELAKARIVATKAAVNEASQNLDDTQSFGMGFGSPGQELAGAFSGLDTANSSYDEAIKSLDIMKSRYDEIKAGIDNIGKSEEQLNEIYISSSGTKLDVAKATDEIEKTINKLSGSAGKTISTFERLKRSLEIAKVEKLQGKEAAFRLRLEYDEITGSQADLLVGLKKESGAWDDVTKKTDKANKSREELKSTYDKELASIEQSRNQIKMTELELYEHGLTTKRVGEDKLAYTKTQIKTLVASKKEALQLKETDAITKTYNDRLKELNKQHTYNNILLTKGKAAADLHNKTLEYGNKKRAEEVTLREKNLALQANEIAGIEKLNDVVADLLSGNIDDIGDLGDALIDAFDNDRLDDAISKLSSKITSILNGGSTEGIGSAVLDVFKPTEGSGTVSTAFQSYGTGSAVAETLGLDEKTQAGAGIGAAIGSAIGNIIVPGVGGAVGSAIGTVAGSIAASLLGGDKEQVGSGVSLNYSDLGASGQTYQSFEEEKSLWRGTDRWDEKQDFESDSATALNDYFDGVKSTLKSQAEYLGYSTDKMKSLKIDSGKLSTVGKSEAEIEAMITEWSISVETALYDSVFGTDFDDLIDAGETIAETLVRTVTQFDAVDKVATLLNVKFDQTGVKALQASDSLVKMMGGLESFGAATEDYYNNFYSGSERAQMEAAANAANVLAFNQSIGATGDAMVDTREEFRAYVESLDLTTTAGQEAFAQAMSVQDSMSALVKTGASLSDVISQTPKEMMSSAYSLMDSSTLTADATVMASASLATFAGELMIFSENAALSAAMLEGNSANDPNYAAQSVNDTNAQMLAELKAMRKEAAEAAEKLRKRIAEMDENQEDRHENAAQQRDDQQDIQRQASQSATAAARTANRQAILDERKAG